MRALLSIAILVAAFPFAVVGVMFEIAALGFGIGRELFREYTETSSLRWPGREAAK